MEQELSECSQLENLLTPQIVIKEESGELHIKEEPIEDNDLYPTYDLVMK